ncbi:MAG: hypothetical protein LBP27_00705, partial [Treponema sp.]|nr:hypothetical protein [Treponema sp.]
NGSPGPDTNGLPPGKVGVINFTTPPQNIWEIRVTTATVDSASDLTSGYAATSSSNAGDFINGKAYLNQAAFPDMEFPEFDPNGTYTIVIVYSGGGAGSIKKQMGVQFAEGSAALDLTTMTAVN